MKILIFSDIHGRKDLFCKIYQEIREADLVILPGDITHFGGIEDLIQILNEIKKYNQNVLAISGNCDNFTTTDVIDNWNVCINNKKIQKYDLIFVGLGGSLPCPCKTLHEFKESDFKNILENEPFKSCVSKEFIFVTHEPPYKTKVDKAWGKIHVGSREIRKYIEVKKPILCICGHIHEAKGIDEISGAKVVNPGSFKHGNYGLIFIENREIKDILLKSI